MIHLPYWWGTIQGATTGRWLTILRSKTIMELWWVLADGRTSQHYLYATNPLSFRRRLIIVPKQPILFYNSEKISKQSYPPTDESVRWLVLGYKIWKKQGIASFYHNMIASNLLIIRLRKQYDDILMYRKFTIKFTATQGSSSTPGKNRCFKTRSGKHQHINQPCHWSTLLSKPHNNNSTLPCSNSFIQSCHCQKAWLWTAIVEPKWFCEKFLQSVEKTTSVSKQSYLHEPINVALTAGTCRFNDSMNWNPANPETTQTNPKNAGKFWGVKTAARATSSIDFSPRRMATLVPWTEWNIRIALVNVAILNGLG